MRVSSACAGSMLAMAVLTSATCFVVESPCQRKVKRTSAVSPGMGSTSGVPTRCTVDQNSASAARASFCADFRSAEMVGLSNTSSDSVVRAPIDAAKGSAAARMSA